MSEKAKAPINKVALDIGSYSIKLLQVSGDAGNLEVAGVGSKNILGLSAAEVSASIRSLADELKITAKEAAISISGSSVIVRFITLPKMDESSLKGAIKYEAEKFIPYDINDCIVDFQILKKEEKDGKLNVLLVAAKSDYVLGRMKLASDAGFTPRLVDVDSFAVANSFLSGRKDVDPEKSFAVLNIGNTTTNLSILKGGLIYFARDIAVGGNDFTAAISKKLSISQKEAEDIKIKPAKEKEQEIVDCVKNAFGDLFDETKLSFSYYENQAGKGIDEIYVSGGAAGTMGLAASFEEALGSRPVVWDVSGCFGLSSGGSVLGPSFAVAAGLALR